MITGQGRIPRGMVKVAGAEVSGWESWTWDGNTLYQADTFHVDFALSALPTDRPASWWSTQAELEVELFAGFPSDPTSKDGLESLFTGFVDEVSIDWDRTCLTLSGRDLTAKFLDNKTSEKFPNQTASQIVTTLAGRRGLTPVVTATSTKVGRYYKDSHVRLEDDRTEWDLLTWLAREENCVVYVQGKELHFAPAPTTGTYEVKWKPSATDQLPSSDWVRLNTTRVLTVARDITVTVNSWNAKQKKAFTRKATRSKKSGVAQNYDYTFPGLTPEQAQLKANQILADLSRHEMRLTMEGPADNLLRKSDLITLSGTGTDFDQTYYPDTISRTLDFNGAYEMHVTAKNHSPESQPNL